MSREIQEAYKEGYRKGYLDGFNKLQNAENKSVDARSTTEWVNIPEAPNERTEREIEDLKKEIEILKDVDEFLHGRIKKLEKAIYG